jgi:hypothetical protein
MKKIVPSNVLKKNLLYFTLDDTYIPNKPSHVFYNVDAYAN